MFFSKQIGKVVCIAACLALSGTAGAQTASEVPVVGSKPFIAYFQPTPVVQELSTTAWGASTVGARDPGNGLEDRTLGQWNYWDGWILKGADGAYRMFAS